jgi:dipeptidyl aminopeptidase/acylaminoacyl peptidase
VLASINLKVCISLLSPMSVAAAESVQTEEAKLASSLPRPRPSTTQSEVAPKAETPVPSRTSESTSQRDVTVQDLQNVSGGGETMELAPHGDAIAYSVGDRVNLMFFGTDQSPTDIGEGSIPRWSHDGSRIAYFATGPNGTQLNWYDVKRRRTDVLTALRAGVDPEPNTRISGWPGRAFTFSWSPDDRFIVFASRVAAQVAEKKSAGHQRKRQSSDLPLVLTNGTPPDLTLIGIFAQIGSNKTKVVDGRIVSDTPSAGEMAERRNQLFILDVNSRKIRQLTAKSSDYFHPDWSPDGSKIVAGIGEPGGDVAEGRGTSIVILDAATGAETNVDQSDGFRYLPKWSPDGKHIAFLEMKKYFGSSTSLRVVTVEGKNAEIVRGARGSINDFQWHGPGALISSSSFGQQSVVLEHFLNTDEVVRIAPEHGSKLPTSIDALAASSTRIIWNQRDPKVPSAIWMKEEKQKSRPIVNLLPASTSWRMGEVEIVTWRNSRGEVLDGSLLRPSNYQPGIRYPLIVDAYPLVVGSSWTNLMSGNYSWAAMGYMVFRPAPRAPHAWVNIYKDEAFSLAGKGPKGWDVTYDDVMSGVDDIIAKGMVDPNRMCLYGFSNGASVVDALVTRTNRFRCAISVSGAMSNLIGPAFLYTASLPFLEELIEASPVFHLGKAKTPMLLAAGDNDAGFLLGSIYMYNGLRHAGVEVTLLRYPRQGHGFTGAAMLDFAKREMEFFARYLKE